MKTLALFMSAACLILCLNVGCSREVSHSESSHPTLLGGQKTSEQTTVQNPDGSYSTEKSTQTTH